MKQGFLIALLLGLITSLHAEPYKTLRLELGEQQMLSTKYSVKRSAIGARKLRHLKCSIQENFF